MSTWDLVERACPGCAAPQRLRVAVSINVARAPNVPADIRRGTFHRFTCTACNETFLYDGPFEYVDFKRKQLFVVRPELEEPYWPDHEATAQGIFDRNLGDPSLPAMVRQMGEGFHIRLMFGLAALREKQMVFEWGVHDAVVEAWKLAWMRAAPLQRLFPDCRPRLDWRPSGAMRFAAIVRGAREPMFLDADLAALRAHPRTDPVVTALGVGPYVDVGRFLFE